MNFLTTILRIVLSVFAPLILIGAGAGLISVGMAYSYDIIIWTGLILIAAGLIWGLIIFFYYSEY